MAVRFSEDDPAITDDEAFTVEERQMTNAELNGSSRGAAVVVVEEDPNLLHRLTVALPRPFNTQSFADMDTVGAARFPSGSPLVLVLGASQADEQVLDKVGSLLRARPGTGAVLVVTQPSADVLRSALRSGIDDAIETYDLERQLPLAVAELVQRLESELAAASVEAARRAAPTGGKKGWVTTVFSPKGGVGKSVVSVNLATALAKRTGKPSVIFDLDLQFGDVAVMLRLNPVHTVVDAMSAGTLLDKNLLQTFLVHHEKSNVWALAAPTAPSEAEQVDPAGMLRVLGLLQEMFENVIIDSPPHLSDVVLQAVRREQQRRVCRGLGRAVSEERPAGPSGLRPPAVPHREGDAGDQPGRLQGPPQPRRHRAGPGEKGRPRPTLRGRRSPIGQPRGPSATWSTRSLASPASSSS